MLIFLIGYMGCGKTTIGKGLANLLGYRFVDMDHEIEAEAGMTIPQLFERYGEEYFRGLEQKKIDQLATETNCIVSTGGGAPCWGDNMDRMNRSGVTVFLNVPVPILVSRLKHGKAKRPLLADKSDEELTAFVASMLEKRLPYYNRAQINIEGHSLRAQDIAAQLEHIKKQ